MVGRPNAQRLQETVFRFFGHTLAVDDGATGAEDDGILQFNGRMRMVEHIINAVALIGFGCPRQLLDGDKRVVGRESETGIVDNVGIEFAVRIDKTVVV